MQRRQWIEISDEAWCPESIRRAVTDYCRFVTELSRVFDAIAPILADALKLTNTRRVLDLGSGAGGPWLRLQPLLCKMGLGATDVTVCLSDYNPDLKAFERASRRSRQAVTYCSDPVDATDVPRTIPGFRTMFSAFHHLRPEQAHAALADAVSKGEGIAVFEAAQRRIFTLLFMLETPVRVLLCVPFLRPFRWMSLVWTYLLPVLPVVLLLDSLVSCLRTYNVEELRGLTAGLDTYVWSTGTVRGKPIPVPITYLVGVPIEGNAGHAELPLLPLSRD